METRFCLQELEKGGNTIFTFIATLLHTDQALTVLRAWCWVTFMLCVIFTKPSVEYIGIIPTLDRRILKASHLPSCGCRCCGFEGWFTSTPLLIPNSPPPIYPNHLTSPGHCFLVCLYRNCGRDGIFPFFVSQRHHHGTSKHSVVSINVVYFIYLAILSM